MTVLHTFKTFFSLHLANFRYIVYKYIVCD